MKTVETRGEYEVHMMQTELFSILKPKANSVELRVLTGRWCETLVPFTKELIKPPARKGGSLDSLLHSSAYFVALC